MSRFLPFVYAVAAVLAAYVALVFFSQRGIIFPAPRGISAKSPRDADVIELVGLDGPVEAWFLRPTNGGTVPAPLLLFTHGNAELIDNFVDQCGPPRAAGYAVLLVEYPGYGRSAGTASEASIRVAVLAAYDWAKSAAAVDPKRIVPYGRSLGGGAACIVAADRPVAALILESSFTSVRAFARHFAVPGFLVRDPFDNLAALRSYRGPLLVLHGALDEIVPIEHGRQLSAAVPGAKLEVLPCGHNDCARPWEQILKFLSETVAVTPSGSPPL
jgi:pimeloyl-ACP methyl ester carboxylesterase